MSDTTLRTRPMWRVVAAAAALSMLLGACEMPAEEENPSTLTAAERDMRAKTEDQRKVDSTVTGAAGGAVAGALVGYLIGGWSGALYGAAAGGVAGGALGYGYGSYMNARARDYSTAEARASAVTESANQTLAYYAQVNASARTILAEQEAKVARLNDDYKSRAITKEQFQTALASANANQANLQEQLQGLDKQLDAMKTDPQAAALGQQILQLQQERDSLKGTYDRLLQIYGTVPAEVRVSEAMPASVNTKRL
jgi:uncharacterized protein YcfJ